MMKNLLEKLTTIFDNKSIAKDFAQQYFKEMHFKKNTILSLNIPNNISWYFIEIGLVRSYYEFEDKDLTSWVKNKDFFKYPFLSKNNSTLEYIHFIENTTLYFLTNQFLENDLIQQPKLKSLLIAIYEDIATTTKEYELLCRVPNITLRYQMFNKLHPNLSYKIPNQILSSLLKIDPKQLYKLKKIK